VAAAVLGVAFAGGALALGLSVQPLGGGDVVRAVGEALAIVLPVLVGIYAVRHTQTAPFGRLLVAIGLAYAPAALALSSNSTLYSIGRCWAWAVIAMLVYLLLAFPAGRLTRRTDRALARAARLSVLLLYLPTALFVEFPTPSPWTGCATHCPANTFNVFDSKPALIAAIIRIRDPLTVVLFGLGAATVGLRWTRGLRAARRVQTPVLAIGVVSFLAWGAFLILRTAGDDGRLTQNLGIASVLALPALALAFLAGLARWRRDTRGSWRELAPEQEPSSATGRPILSVLAEAIGDPSLEIAYWGEHIPGWIDEDGRQVAVPPAGSVRAMTEISARGLPVALFVHDDSELAEAAIREVVRGPGLLALQNHQIEAEARAKLRELTESRARIIEAIDKDRLRIERDLHDGAQQRLISLKIAADRGADAARSGETESADLFKRIAADATAALAEVRSLSRGVYPALLVDHGIVEGLRDAASRSPLDVTVHAHGIGRYPQEVEAAVYFCCMEALQNAEKHGGASAVSIRLSDNGRIAFEVRDDGRGFDPESVLPGSGLTHIRDRVAAMGGVVRVESVIGEGAVVAGSMPSSPGHIPVEIERFVLRAADALDPFTICRAVRTSSGAVVDFMIEHANDAACRAAGLSREAQVGKTLGQLNPGYPHSSLFQWHCEVLTSSESATREDIEFAGGNRFRRIAAATETRAFSLGAERLGLLSRDITARKRAERALELRSEALAEEGAAVCVVREDSGTIVTANREFERMFGYAENELEGRLAAAFDASDTAPGPSEPDVFRLRRKDGSTFWSQLSRHGFHDPDLGWCFVEVHRDVTATKESAVAAAADKVNLAHALRALPALGYTAGRDLRPTLLFDSLIDPDGDQRRTGDASEVFGRDLGRRITEVNRRVVVTGRAATAEIEFASELGDGGLGAGTLTVDPMLTSTGAIVGVVGSLLCPDAGSRAQRVKPPAHADLRDLREEAG
jgi:signal transduction histidine kinase